MTLKWETTCHKCGKQGHWVVECWLVVRSDTGKPNTGGAIGVVLSCNARTGCPEHFKILVQVCGTNSVCELTAVVDSRAMENFISQI